MRRVFLFLALVISTSALAQTPMDAFNQARQQGLLNQQQQLCTAALQAYLAGRGPPPPPMCGQAPGPVVVQAPPPQGFTCTRIGNITRCN